MHRSILVVDIERSTARTNPIKEELREQVYRMLDQAMSFTGIEEHWCDPFEDRGDGVLVLVHPVDDLPKIYLLSRLIPELARQLEIYNLGVPDEDRRRRGLRLRAVVHAGEIHRDPQGHGYFGEALDVACRLLDAPGLKRCLQDAAAPLVLAVSEDIYWAIVKHEYSGICAATYHPGFRVLVAGRRHQAYVHIPQARSHRRSRTTWPEAPGSMRCAQGR